MTNSVVIAACSLAIILISGWIGEMAAYSDYMPMTDRILAGLVSAAGCVVGGMMAAAAAEDLKRG